MSTSAATLTAKEAAERRRDEISRIAGDARRAQHRDAKKAAICELLRRGSTIRASTAACGVNVQTFYNWQRDDPEFAAAVAAAEGEVETVMAACVADAAPTDWRAAESWLKRRRRDEWGDSLDIQSIMAQASTLRDDQLARKLYGEGAVIEVEGRSEDLPSLGEGDGDE